MSLYTVANTLTLVNQRALIKIWDSSVLNYRVISSFNAPDSQILDDNITIEVLPISQQGLQTYEAVLDDGTIHIISLYFYDQYYKNKDLIPDYPRYFPNNMFIWGKEDANTALMEGAEAIAEEVIEEIQKEGLIALNQEFNKTFPQFCDNSLLGIAIPFIYNQVNVYNQRPLAYRIFLDPLTSISSENDFLLPAQPLTAPVDGKVMNILYNDETITLKYGAKPDGTFCGKQKMIYIQNVASGLNDPRLIWDSLNLPNQWNNGVWDGLEGTGDEPINWRNSPGIPLSTEVGYIRQDYEIDSLDNYDQYIIPDITFFQGTGYTPGIWFSQVTNNLNEIIIGYSADVGFILLVRKI